MRTLRSAEGSQAPFDLVTITLHWLTVTLIILQAVSGLTLEFAEGTVPTQPLLDFHRSFGAAVWGVALTRIVWRWSFAKFPPFPEWMSNTQKWIATKTEYLIYGLLLLQPITGLVTTLLLGKPFQLFLWTVPALIHRNLDLWETMLFVHRVGAYVLFAVVSGHATMALFHHYVFRDEVLARMAPWGRQRRSRLAVIDGSAATSAAER